MNQMDLEFTMNRIKDYLPNSTKCMTWQGVKASHETDNSEVVVQIDDIFGMLILLTSGLGISLVVLTLELLRKTQNESKI